jgi:hypothetical protein
MPEGRRACRGTKAERDYKGGALISFHINTFIFMKKIMVFERTILAAGI